MVGICLHFPKDSRSLHNPLDRVPQLRHLRLLDAVVVLWMADTHCWLTQVNMGRMVPGTKDDGIEIEEVEYRDCNWNTY